MDLVIAETVIESLRRTAEKANVQAEQLGIWCEQALVVRRLRCKPIPVEGYLQAFPSLRSDAVLVLLLIAREVTLRLKKAESITLDALLERFPDYTEQLKDKWASWLESESTDLPETLQASRRNDVTLTGANAPRIPFFGFLDPPENPGEFGLLSSYRIHGLLGEGGMGIVLLGEERLTRRQVAIKVMRPELANDPDSTERFLREGRLAASLEHERIVPIYRVDEFRGTPFLVMPLLKGESLESRITRNPPLSVLGTLSICREIAEGLAVAHSAGLIHRDIKPANIWLKRSQYGDRHGEGHAMLLDFGLARQQQQSSMLTDEGAIVGTACYMAPEQAAGEPLDHRCDLFSLGCILYKLSTGIRPFKGPNLMAILERLANHTPIPPAELTMGIPRGLSDLTMSLLEKDRANRPSSTEEVLEKLRLLEGQSAITLAENETPCGKSRRLSWVWRVIILLALTEFTVGVYLYFPGLLRAIKSRIY